MAAMCPVSIPFWCIFWTFSKFVGCFERVWDFSVLQIRSVIRVITLITLLCCFDEEGHSLYSKKDILCVRRRTLLVFEEGQPLCSTNEIPYVRGRTFCVFEAEHSVCSKQEVPCVRNRTFLVIEAGHSLCSKQDIPCVRSRTFFVFEAGHSLCSKQDIACVANKRFRVFQSPTMHMPLFGEFNQSSQDLGES